MEFNNILFFPDFYSKDRQFRIEQRDDDGSIRGQYGYVDKRGRVHLTKYTSTAEQGFRSERVPT